MPMLRRSVRPRVLIPGLLLGAALAALGGIEALANFRVIFPDPVSPNGRHLFSLYELISIPAIIIFLGVEAAILYTIFKFRASRRPVGFIPPQWHGNTLLEVVWTVIPLIIVFVIAGLSAGELVADYQSGSSTFHADLDITVRAHQFGWTYIYPNGYQLAQEGSATGTVKDFVVPVGQVVRLRLEGEDVIHSWWVPALEGKQDAVPGYDNFTWFKIDPSQAGHVFRGECAELCGVGHYTMQIRVKAVTQSEFSAWLAQQAASPSPSASPSAAATPSPAASASPSAAPSPSPSP